MPAVNILSLHTQKSGDGTSDYIYSDVVPAGETWLVRNVCAQDETTAIVYYAIGIFNGVTYRPLKIKYAMHDEKEYLGPGADWQGEVWLREGECIYAYLAVTEASDDLTLDVQGEKLLEA